MEVKSLCLGVVFAMTRNEFSYAFLLTPLENLFIHLAALGLSWARWDFSYSMRTFSWGMWDLVP